MGETLSTNHFTVTGIVFNSSKQVLLIYHKNLQVWLPPSGHIEENELPDDAVLRIIYKESEIKAEILLNKQEFSLSDNYSRGLNRPFTVLLENIEGDWSHNHIDMVYICKAENDDLNLQKSGTGDIGWFSLEQINELNLYKNVKITIKKAVEYLFKYENNIKKILKIPSNKLSHYLSRILRHRPEEIGLNIDNNGWAVIDEMIENSRVYKGMHLSIDVIKEVVRNNDKQRFKISDDGKKIRASQGHSFPVDLGYVCKEPPAILFHGTTSRFIASIMKDGLLSKGRNQVHLSLDKETALIVGKRHGEAIVLSIDSGKMYKDGFKFYLSDNNVWLVDNVPAEYINQLNRGENE